MHTRLAGRRQRLTAALLAAVVLAMGTVLAPPGTERPVRDAGDAENADSADNTVALLLGHRPGGEPAVSRAIRDAGGEITHRLGVIDAQAAVLPRPQVPALAAHPAVSWVTPDRSVPLASTSTTVASAPAEGTSLRRVAETVGAEQAWGDGFSGAGVDVAVIDSGVAPVDGLTAPGKVVNGPDLSFENGEDGVRYLDTYGHGTHMAGIIAGRDDAVPSPVRTADPDRFVGIAPDARIINLKVADSGGATDVSQVIAAIDWVVQHGRRNGLNIRVLNLSFGTDGIQDYRLDPLSHAVEQAWHHGIVVVTAAGNDGYGDARVNNPALNPYVIAVGGSDGRGTVSIDDDVVASWSSRGDSRRRPDLVAPGQSVVSLRDPGSRLDLAHPGARVGERFFRGSGTSQAAAVVSGAAALLLQQRPGLRPDQVKSLLTSTARPLPAADQAAQGAGLLDVQAAAAAPAPLGDQSWPPSAGTGSLELARGSHHVSIDGEPLVGERSVFLTAWSAYGWLNSLPLGTTWTGGSWSGGSWTGGSWTGNDWSGGSWTGGSWTGGSWTGGSWTGGSWTGDSWSAHW